MTCFRWYYVVHVWGRGYCIKCYFKPGCTKGSVHDFWHYILILTLWTYHTCICRWCHFSCSILLHLVSLGAIIYGLWWLLSHPLKNTWMPYLGTYILEHFPPGLWCSGILSYMCIFRFSGRLYVTSVSYWVWDYSLLCTWTLIVLAKLLSSSSYSVQGPSMGICMLTKALMFDIDLFMGPPGVPCILEQTVFGPMETKVLNNTNTLQISSGMALSHWRYLIEACVGLAINSLLIYEF